jgi:hypothetical protein
VSDIDAARADLLSHGAEVSGVYHYDRQPGRAGELEARVPVAPPHDWWDWYAAYLNARERGSTSEQAATTANRYMADVKGVVVPEST